MAEDQTPEPIINTILIGDWILDEHWITSAHSIPTSSRTGGNQRFILNDISQEILNFASAGVVADCLLEEGNDYHITGIGIWESPHFKNIVKSFFDKDAAYRDKRNEFRINWEFGESCGETDIIPHGKNSICFKNLNPSEDDIGSDRVIRIYDKVGDHVSLMERVDFFSNNKLSEFKIKYIENFGNTIEDLTKYKATIKRVIIKDLEHGCVTAELIEKLTIEFPPTDHDYFISSKVWMPGWLSHFEGKPIKLLMIPEIAATQAMKYDSFDGWMTKDGFLTREAMDILKYISIPNDDEKKKIYCDIEPGVKNETIGPLDKNNSIFRLQAENIVVLPFKERVIGFNSKTIDDTYVFECYLQLDAEDKYSEIELPFASRLFPEIIRRISNGTPCLHDLGINLIDALTDTIKWRKEKHNIIKQVKQENGEDKFGKWRQINLKNALIDWNDSLHGNGIRKIEEIVVQNSGPEFNSCELKFELWRAKITLPGYICVQVDKKLKIRRLFNQLKSCCSKKLIRSEVCFIRASPGSGKSHLVGSLAKALDLEILTFNVSQLQTKDQLLNCFDEINTAQSAKKDNKPFLVFFDEINSRIENSYPYSFFLAPLEDGYYVRNNHKFQLKPCIWVFVGTHFETGNKDKASDFKSRFTLPVVNLIADDKEDEKRKLKLNRLKEYVEIQELHVDNILKNDFSIEDKIEETMKEIRLAIPMYNDKKSKYYMSQQLEKVYYGVQFIRSTFKPVLKVSESVLNVFKEIRPEASVRDIRKFVEAIPHIPFDEIRIAQIKSVIDQYERADTERRDQLFDEDGLKEVKAMFNNESEIMVRIYDNPTVKQLKSNFPKP